MRGRLVLVLLALVALAGSAAAAHVEGTLRAADAWTLDGPARLGGGPALVDVTRAADAGALDTAWTRATVRLESNATYADATTGKVLDYVGGSESVWNVTHARLVRVACHDACAVLAFTRDGGDVGLAGPAVALPARSPRAYAVHAGAYGDDARSMNATFPPGSFLATSDDASFAGWAPDATGAFSLYLSDCDVTLATDQGTRTISLGWTREPNDAFGPLGRELVWANRTFALVDVQAGALAARAGAPFEYHATAPTLTLRGGLATDDASGSLDVDGRAERVAHERVLLRGTLALAPDASATTLADGDARTLHVDGDASRVVIGDAVLVSGPPASRAVAAEAAAGATLLVGLGVLAYVLRHAWLGALYSRIDRGSVLANANRLAVYDAVAAMPAATIADLVRATSLARVVVRHHLHILVTHQLVALRSAGGRTVYVAPQSIFTPRESEDARLLAVDARRRVAEQVAQRGVGVTQGEIMEAIGISQRLASYHLAKLEGRGLVVREDGVPHRFVPGASLDAALRAAQAAALATKG